MMYNDIQEQQMRLAKGDGVGGLQAYHQVLDKYRER